MKKDFIEIKVRNNYGDSFERNLEDPTCDEVIQEFVLIAQQLGYPLGCIYWALDNQKEEIKSIIMTSYKRITEEQR